jgi:hypothetical protein
MTMSNSLNQNTGADCDMLALEQLETVSGGMGGDKVVIVGCTTRPPVGGYPPGTIVINPWLGGVIRW